MLNTVALLLLANAPPDQTTLPRHPDPDPVEHQAQRDGTPTDPLLDRGLAASDAPAFILSAAHRPGSRGAPGTARRYANRSPVRSRVRRLRRSGFHTLGRRKCAPGHARR